ncbi:DUF6892 domain-containing protein [Ottowia sp.]|uniref:DUF6892 domain-containing protein n=1 Tax=Ottowia sp. TaxID=1898956 RepID=UPI003A89ABE0
MTETPADHFKLAALRPGASTQQVTNAYGERWMRPLPHREGRVLSLDSTHGVVARMTQRGELGSIRFNWRFGNEFSVLGVPMNAPLKIIEKRFPGIDLAPLKMKPFAWLSHVKGPNLHVRMEMGSTHDHQRYLRWIELFDPAAVYPEKQPVAFPAPSGEAGTPFKDANFKLAVLSELMEKAHIDIGEPQDLAEHVLGRPVDLEEEGYASIPQAQAYLARYPLSPQLLAQVRSLELDGGTEIYSYIHRFWGGETEEFDITSFEGIEALPNLKQVRIISMVDMDKVDLSPLKQRGITIK